METRFSPSPQAPVIPSVALAYLELVTMVRESLLPLAQRRAMTAYKASVERRKKTSAFPKGTIFDFKTE